jgi:hypothetical protein
MKLKLIHIYDTKVITYHSEGGKRDIYILSTLGKIVTANVFRLINTCIERATELELIDRIINANVSDGNTLSWCRIFDSINLVAYEFFFVF